MSRIQNREWTSTVRETAETIAHLVSIASGKPHVVTEVGQFEHLFAVTPTAGNEQARVTYGDIANVKAFFGAANNVCDDVKHYCNDEVRVPTMECLGRAGHVAFA